MDVTLTVDTKDPQATSQEVGRIYKELFGPRLFTRVECVLGDVVRLFGGHYPGYRACDTLYHDLEHTLQAYLAAARIFDGIVRADGTSLSEESVALGLVSSLGHDTGFIKKSSDREGTGAKYTMIHVDRSKEFMSEYLSGQKFGESDIQCVKNMISCTGLAVDVTKISFVSESTAEAGYVLGTADYLGQMSDPCYIDKLPRLYLEFVEGGVPGYDSAQDLIDKTPAFFEGFVMGRLREDFRCVYQGAAHHFGGKNVYLLGIERNLARLKSEKQDRN